MIDDLGLEPFTQDEFERWQASRRWRYAKTMPRHPHFYTLRKWGDAPPFEEYGFERAIVTVRRMAVTSEQWGRYTWIYYHAGGYKYWTTPDDSQGVVSLLNRTYTDDMLVEVIRRDARKAEWSPEALEAFAHNRPRNARQEGEPMLTLGLT